MRFPQERCGLGRCHGARDAVTDKLLEELCPRTLHLLVSLLGCMHRCVVRRADRVGRRPVGLERKSGCGGQAPTQQMHPGGVGVPCAPAPLPSGDLARPLGCSALPHVVRVSLPPRVRRLARGRAVLRALEARPLQVQHDAVATSVDVLVADEPEPRRARLGPRPCRSRGRAGACASFLRERSERYHCFPRAHPE